MTGDEAIKHIRDRRINALYNGHFVDIIRRVCTPCTGKTEGKE
jgi:hypothetical protein